MNVVRQALLLLLFLTVFGAVGVDGQAESRRFVSIYGNFTIALPETPNLTRGVRNLEAPDKGAGMISAWNRRNVVYTVLYLDPLDGATTVPTPEEKAEALNENNRSVRDTVAKYQGKITAEKPIVIGALEGTEIRATIGSGQLIVRNFQVGRRSYSIQAIIDGPEAEAEAMTAISSFRLFDGRAELDRIITSLTPPPFTEKARKRQLKSDVELNALRGRVAVVREETEDLTGDEFQQGRIFAGTLAFDADGLQTLEVTTTDRGIPIRVVALGYQRGVLSARIGGSQKKERNAVDLRLLKLFDTAGRLVETKYTDLKGSVKSTTRYTYKDRTVEISVLGANGQLQDWKRDTLDERGNVIETNFEQSDSDGPENRSVFIYDGFDENGNWTKRVEQDARVVDGRKVLVPVKVTYRSLLYHSK